MEHRGNNKKETRLKVKINKQKRESAAATHCKRNTLHRFGPGGLSNKEPPPREGG